MIQPLNSYWEYTKARQLLDSLPNFSFLSPADKEEGIELYERVKAYEYHPTPPNIIHATKGNV